MIAKEKNLTEPYFEQSNVTSILRNANGWNQTIDNSKTFEKILHKFNSDTEE